MPSVSDAFPELFSQDDSLTPREVQTDASPTLINFGNALGRGIASAVQSLPVAPRAIDRAFPEITPQKPNPTDFLDDAVRADRFTNYNKGVIGNEYSPYRYEQLGDTPDNFYDAAVENAKTKWKSLYPDTPWGATQDNYIRQKALAYDMAHRFATTGDRGQMQMRGAIGRMNDEQRALFEQSLQEVADWQKETKTDRFGKVGAQQPNDTFLGQAAERLDKSIVRGIQDNWNAWGDSKSKEAGYQLAKNRRVTDAAQPQAGPNITGNKSWAEFAVNAPRAGALAAVSQIPDLALSTSAMAASNAVLPGSGQLTGMAYWYNRLYPEAYATMRDAGFKPGTAEATAHGTAVINGAIEMFNDIVPVPGMDDPTNKVIAKTWREWIKNNAIDIGKRFGKEWGEEAAQAVTEEAVKRVAQVIEPDVPLDAREQLGKIATQVVEAGLTLPWMAAGGNAQGLAQSAAQTQAKISADKTRLGRQQGVNDLVTSTDYVQGWMQRSPEQAAAMAQTDTPSRSQWEAAGLPRGVSGTQRKAFADAVRQASGMQPEKIDERVSNVFKGYDTKKINLKFADTGATVDAHMVTMPNGKRIVIDSNRDTIVFDAERIAADYGVDVSRVKGAQARGKYRQSDGVGLIELLRDFDNGTLAHEKLHALFDLAYTEDQKKAILATYKTEERAAEAYRRQTVGGRGIGDKLLSLVEKLRTVAFGTKFPDLNGSMSQPGQTQPSAFADAVRQSLASPKQVAVESNVPDTNRDTNRDAMSRSGQDAATPPANNPAEMAGQVENPAKTGQVPATSEQVAERDHRWSYDRPTQQAPTQRDTVTQPIASDPTPADVAETADIQLGPVQAATKPVEQQENLSEKRIGISYKPTLGKRLTDTEIAAIREQEQRDALTARKNDPEPAASDLVPPAKPPAKRKPVRLGKKAAIAGPPARPWREQLDETGDVFRKSDILRLVANHNKIDSDLREVVDKIKALTFEGEPLGEGANTAWAVMQNPNASEETKAAAREARDYIQSRMDESNAEVDVEDKPPTTLGKKALTPEPAQDTMQAKEDGDMEAVAKPRPSGARKATAAGAARQEAARQMLQDAINNPDLVGKQRADTVANLKELVAFYQANAGSDKPLDTAMRNGDEIAYTGVVTDDGFREFIYLDGAKAGAYGQAMTEAEKESSAKAKQDNEREMQEGFARLHEKVKTADEATAYQEAIAAANTDPEMNGYNAVLRGLDAVLKSKELPTRPKDYGESSKDFPYLWELSGMFHSPLAGMTGNESLEQVTKAIAMQHKLDENAERNALRDIQQDSGILRGAFNKSPAETKAEIVRDRRSTGMSNTRAINEARKESDRFRRKAEIMQALGIEADGYLNLADKLDSAAQAKEDRLNKLYDDAVERERNLPFENAKKITSLDDHKATVVQAWDGDVTGDESGFVSDGLAMIPEDAITPATVKKLRGRRAANREPGRNVPSETLAKVWKDTAKPMHTASLVGTYKDGQNDYAVIDTGADFLYYDADKVAYITKVTGATEYATNPRDKGSLKGASSLVFLKNNRPVAVLAANKDVVINIDRETALTTAKSFSATAKTPTKLGKSSTTARQAADAAQAEFEREAQAGPQPSAFAAGPTAVPPRPRNNTIPAAVQADNPEVERQLQDASGVSKDGLLKRLAGAVPQALKMATRAQEHIPNTPKWAADNEAFRLLKTIANTSQDEANRDIAAITDRLGPQPLQLFSRKVIIDNLYESVQRGEPLRFGFDSITEVKQYKDKLDALASSSPEVQDAIDTRKKIVKELAQDLVDMGLLDEKAIERADTYYHQQVLSKFEASRNHAGAGPKETKRGFQKSRVEGVEKFDEDLNYNTSYIEAEFEWMRDAHAQLRLEKWIRDLAKRHDIIEDVKKAAKDSGEDWRRMVRESGTHKIWQAEPGNVFYPAVGIDEQVVADVLAGLTDTAEIGLDDLRSLIVLGGKRREMVLPNEIVDQLNAVQERSKTGQIGRVVRDIGNYWKVWTLLNPIKAVGYNLRNVTGDLDPVMGGAIGVLQPKYFGKSFGELRDYYGIMKQQKLSLSPELQVARDLGVIDSSMTSDIPDLEDLEVFKRFYTGQSKSLLDYGKLYFDKIKKYSTFRENLSRYAAFLYYRDALKEGTLAHYGGARKAIVDQLVKDMGVDVAAAHLSRNLLGDYGDLTVMGNWLRAYAMPFYSWTEVNLKRYPRIIYNAGMYGPRKFGKSPAAVAASVAAAGMVAVPYIIMQAWNNLVWGDEEDKLSDDERASPHLILGKNDDGSLIILRNTGALGDFLEWFGVNMAVSRLDEINAGQMGYGDVIAESAKQDVNKVASGIRPDIKAFYEMSSGNSTFPDVFNPRKQRRDDMAAGYLGLTDYYRGLRGAVLQDGSRMRKYQVERMLGVTDPRRNALFEISELRDRYLKKLGSSGGFMPNLYFSNMRDAAMNGDIEAFKEARLKWLTDGDSPGDYEKFKERLKGLDPLSQKMNNEKENDFVDNYLSSAQRDKLRMARDYAGQMQVEMWKMWNQSVLDDTGGVKAKINEQRVKEATSKARAILANDEPKTLSATDKKEGITLGVKKQAIRDAAAEARDWIKDSGLDKSEVEDAVWAWIKDDLSTDKGRLAKMRQFQKKMGWSEWTRGK